MTDKRFKQIIARQKRRKAGRWVEGQDKDVTSLINEVKRLRKEIAGLKQEKHHD